MFGGFKYSLYLCSVNLNVSLINNTTMSNKDVIKSFIQGKSTKSSNGNLWVSYDGKRLFNYYTCIAQRTTNGFVLNATKYSCTTSKIQHYLRNMLPRYTEVTNIKIGANELVQHLHTNKHPSNDNGGCLIFFVLKVLKCLHNSNKSAIFAL